MLTAHRQEPQPGTASLSSGTQAGGFAKVLTSIQGLQQRLDGFSLEEASHAEANVGTIIQQLFAVQAKLKRLTELKQFVASANSMIGEIPEQNFEQVDLDALEDHPQLHAIIQASKLIRVHKLMQATKAGVDALSFHDEAASLQISGAETSSFTAPMSSLAPPDSSTASLKETAFHDVPPPVLEAPAKNLPEGGWVFSADAELEYTEPQFVEHTVSVIGDREDKVSSKAISNVSTPIRDESVVVRETGFDERLLSDLIQAYGEFSPVIKSSSATTQPRAAEIESRDRVIPSSPLPRVTAPEISTEAELIREDSSKPLVVAPEEQRANSQTLISATLPASDPKTISKAPKSTGLAVIRTDVPMLPQLKTDRAEPESKNPTSLKFKKHGELDRQLKNIIKDYGEYDLYSHQSSTTVKKVALVAFAALAFLLAVLYFFKAPSSRKNPAANSVTQSADTSKTSENGADAAHRREFKTKARNE